eukprot:SAG31_NODE_23742_length_497_cov_0.912060_1_plen_44_part_10
MAQCAANTQSEASEHPADYLLIDTHETADEPQASSAAVGGRALK